MQTLSKESKIAVEFMIILHVVETERNEVAMINNIYFNQGQNFNEDYFDDLLKRIRAIRASEKLFYGKIRDIYALSVDYNPRSEDAKTFFATVQNKLHWAVHGHTAAELIVERVDANKANMGLTTWKGDRITKDDVKNAKNYLEAEELNSLNRLVTMFLDYAEDQAEQRTPMYMKDWEVKLNDFLEFYGRKVLNNPGRVQSDYAKNIAFMEYDKYSRKKLS